MLFFSAISKQAPDIVKEFSSDHKNGLAAPKLYLVTSALHSIVSSADIDNYQQAITYIEYLYENCKDLIPFRIYSKLITGIKMIVSCIA